MKETKDIEVLTPKECALILKVSTKTIDRGAMRGDYQFIIANPWSKHPEKRIIKSSFYEFIENQRGQYARPSI